MSFEVIRVTNSDPFKVQIQSFNLYCSTDYLLRGIGTLSVLIHVCVVTCLFGHRLADFFLSVKMENQRKEISSLFNALFMMMEHFYFCSTIFFVEGIDSSRIQLKGAMKKWCKKKKIYKNKKHGV